MNRRNDPHDLPMDDGRGRQPDGTGRGRGERPLHDDRGDYPDGTGRGRGERPLRDERGAHPDDRAGYADDRAGYADDRGAYRDDRGAYAGEPADRRKGGAGLGIAALLLGLLALAVSWVPVLGVAGIVLGLIAIIVGLVARGRAKRINGSGRGSGVAGAMLGLLAVIIGGLITFGIVSLVQNTDAGQCLQDAGTDQAKIEQCLQEYGDEARDRLDEATTNN